MKIFSAISLLIFLIVAGCGGGGGGSGINSLVSGGSNTGNSGSEAKVSLAWDPSSNSNVAGYKLYYGNSSRTYESSIDVGNVTTYTFQGLTAGHTYYVAVTAYDHAKDESGFSDEIECTPR